MTAATIAPPAREGAGTGTFRVVPFLLRRDRILLPIWGLLTVAVLLGAVAGAESTYPTAQSRMERFQQLQELPIFLLFQSAAFDDSLAALATQQAFGATTLFSAIGALLLVVRHTRTEEQHGRRELLGSTAIGRNAQLVASVLTVMATGLVIGLVGAAGLLGLGFSMPGSLLFGLVATGATWIGVALGALLAQVTENARAAAVAGFVLVMLLHYVRGLGHLADGRLEWITMLSPAGWLEGVQPYAGDRWWMLLPVAGVVALLLLTSLAISSRRDLGEGLIATRHGRASGAPYLRDVFGLSLRQNAASFLTWAVAIALIGVAFGSVGTEAAAEYGDTTWMLEYAAAMRIEDPGQAFFVYTVFVFVFPITAYATLNVLRLRSDETSGNAELLLSAPLTRSRWATATILTTLLGSAALVVIFGLALTVSSPGVGGLFTLTFSLIPAVWVFVGIVVLAIGLVPRAAVALAWIALGAGIAGEILVKTGLPDIVYLATSPIGHVNPYYTTAYSWMVLLAIAALTTVLGILGLRRRDLSR
ncbi:exporter of polyketide antibiotics [Pseudoclavibacter endophyticus]|uniref:Antibiotic ABC transporter n=1 Tax=Pseudoclavibacter endophyticus TaxID=1778590 RepID=A0A6H9WAG4_9MICO|nr:antibiotic ABC transporter [Pseudoclavibacter endophyticus]KAB1646704.1 antibiotic ABC transporter [Pseudoclavibacter endophyticus]GGA76263.1 exporter of polyketide antibiotics [Pseudoclavibacter endophyticus]